MINARLEELTLSNFRSFLAKSTVVFPATGFVLLRGVNHDTGGSSGSGKSNFSHGINYALGTCSIPSTELQAWGTNDPPSAKLKIATNAGTLLISRGKKFELTVDGKAVTGSVKQKEEQLHQCLGLSPEMLMALTYRGQRQPGLFLAKTDSEKKEFLTALLGLDKFEAAIEATKVKISDLEGKVTVAQSKRDAIQQQLASIQSRCTDIERLEQENAQLTAEILAEDKRLEAYRAEYRTVKAAGDKEADDARQDFYPRLLATKAAVSGLEHTKVTAEYDPTELTNLTALLAECQTRLERLQAEDSQKRKDLDSQRSEITKSIQVQRQRVAEEPLLLKDRSRILAIIEKLDANTCPTCERGWLAAESAAQREKQVRALFEIDTALDSVQTAKAKLAELEADLTALPKWEPNPGVARMQEMHSQVQSQLATELQRIQGLEAVQKAERSRKIAEAKAILAAAEQEIGAEVNAINARVNAHLQEIQTKAETCRGHIQKLQADLLAIQNALGSARERAEVAAGLQDQLATQNAALSELESLLAAERDFGALIGREGFLGSIFQQVLEEIAAEANHALASIANTRHCTIEFRTESVTQKGSIKRSIVPVVTVNGHETSLGAGLSGGQLSTVELAVDLALGAVISRRSGVCPGWLILDESFDGLDPVSKESCLEILQRYAEDRLVLVVDHMSEFAGLFPATIEINYRDGQSRFA